MPEYFIRDEAVKRDNFTIIPNVIANLGLSVYTFRLYFHIKMVAGEDGLCWQSLETLAEYCGMSVRQVGECKKELIFNDLIAVENKIHANGNYQEITIKDVWAANKKYFNGGGSAQSVVGLMHMVQTNKNTDNNIYNDEQNEKRTLYAKPKPERKSKKKMMDESDLQIRDMYLHSKKSQTESHKTLPENYLPNAELFIKHTGMQFLPKFIGLWISGLDEWSTLGVVEEDIIKAVAKLRDAGLSIISPGSLTKTLNSIVAERKTRKDKGYNPWN